MTPWSRPHHDRGTHLAENTYTDDPDLDPGPDPDHLEAITQNRLDHLPETRIPGTQGDPDHLGTTIENEAIHLLEIHFPDNQEDPDPGSDHLKTIIGNEFILPNNENITEELHPLEIGFQEGHHHQQKTLYIETGILGTTRTTIITTGTLITEQRLHDSTIHFNPPVPFKKTKTTGKIWIIGRTQRRIQT